VLHGILLVAHREGAPRQFGVESIDQVAM
jgi:hypothetical protein